MPHPLLQRIHLDAEFEWNNFLLNATYGEDFVPTRDRSIGYGALWVFKQCKDDAEDEPTDVRRGHLLPYMSQVFGEIDAIECLGHTRVLRLKCPAGVTCRLAHAFAKQLSAATSIIHEDATSADGKIVSSWLSTSWMSLSLPYIPGTFYVDLPSRHNAVLGVGSKIELTVGLKRIETNKLLSGEPSLLYSMTACEVWNLSAADLPVRGQDYECDVSLIGGCVLCNQSTTSST